MIVENIHNNCILYNTNSDVIIKNYYLYVANLCRVVLYKQGNLGLNLILGDYHYDFGNTNRLVKIEMNYEHTLVKPGGRHTHDAPSGNIKIPSNLRYQTAEENYLVRICEYEKVNKNDIVVDYSNPNIVNVKESGSLLEEFYNKLIYVSPILYDCDVSLRTRRLNCITTFISLQQPRRAKLLENILHSGISHLNIKNCFTSDTLQQLYFDTKIIINIHQTDEHHTLEELRVLPALLCGVIVICEESPLKQHVPYSHFIVWTTYENIIETVKNVQENYDRYYNKLFISSDFKDVIETMKNDNLHRLSEKIISSL